MKKTEKGLKNSEKTNVMRILEQHHIVYTPHFYQNTGAVSGVEVALALDEDPKQVFKTLVTVGKSGQHYVFVIPVEKELDLKKAASSVGEKAVEMIPQKALLPTTGYIHGGCSPIGMKKPFQTVFHQTAAQAPTVIFSAGKIGFQVELQLEDLRGLLDFTLDDVVKSC